MQLYTSKQVAEKAGISYRTLMRWAEEGLLRPAVYPQKRGRQTLFDRKDFREAMVLGRLREYFSLDELRQVIDTLRNMGHNPLSRGAFAVAQDIRGERVLLKIIERQSAEEGKGNSTDLEIIKLLEDNEDSQMVLFPIYDIEEIINDTPPAGEAKSDRGQF